MLAKVYLATKKFLKRNTFGLRLNSSRSTFDHHMTTSLPAEKKFHQARIGILAAVMFCYFFYYTGRQNFGFAIPGMAEELGLSKSQLGWCGAAMLWAYAIGQAINGPLADRFGGRKLMTLGGLLSFVMNWIVSLAGGLVGVIVPWAGNGFVQSMGWAPGSRILSNWWGQEHRGRVYGFYLFAAGCSSVLTYFMAATIVGHGWRWIFRIPVILMVVGSVVFWITVRDRPSDRGFADLDEAEPKVATESADGETLRWWQRYMIGFTCLPFMLGCIAIGFQNLARYGLLVWVPVHFLGSDWKDSPQRWITVALPVGMAVGAITAGWLSDRVFKGNRSRPVILFLSVAAACALGMAGLPRDSVVAVPLLFLTGFFVYGPQSAFWALCPDLLGNKFAGTGTGMMNFFAYLFAGLGEPLIGAVIERTHSTHMVFPVVAGACLAGAVLMMQVNKKI